MIKRILVLVIWVAVGMLLAFGGQTAWRYWQQRDPETTEDVAAHMQDTITAGKKTAAAAAAGLRQEAEAALQEPPAEKPAAAPEPEVAVEDREERAHDRLDGLVGDDPPPAATTETNEELAADRTAREERRRREEDALFQRQMRIFDELSGE